MRPTSIVRGKYSRVSRDRNRFTFGLVPEIEGDRTCIFCDSVSGEPELQSVYYPPVVASARLGVDNRGMVGYCCTAHYARYNRLANAGHLYPTFEEFYVVVGGTIIKRSRTNSVPKDDKPGSLKYFRTSVDAGLEPTVWYSGFGYLEQIRVRPSLYQAFSKSIHENLVLGMSGDERRSWYQKFCTENEVNEKESRAFEHFLKL